MEPPLSQSTASGSSLPSSPLSFLSKSPSLPPSPLTLSSDAARRYPTPTSSAIPSGSVSPMKPLDLSQEICVRTDGPPPAKRRRVAAPKKPRTTEFVDLDVLTDEADANLDRLVSVLKKKKRIVVIAGAGISVSAGIPDFRSSTGLFSTLRGEHKLKASGKHLFDASVYRHDSSTASFHKMVRELAHLTRSAQPTAFHHMLASLAVEGRLMRLYTQNVDCIDTSMKPLATNVPLNEKGPWPLTIQLHGGLEKMVCTKCGQLENFDGSLFEGAETPLCEKCKEQEHVRMTFAGKRSQGVGRLRPRIVLYNEYNPDEEAIGNVMKADLRRIPDAVIVVGTSLKIPGVRRAVKEMCQVARSRKDGFTAWINIDGEPQGADFKDCWDLVVRGRCDDVATLAALTRWDEQDIGDWAITGGDGEKETLREKGLARVEIAVDIPARTASQIPEEKAPQPDVVVVSKSRLGEKVQTGGILTPGASPKMRSPLPDKPQSKSKTKQSRLAFTEKTDQASSVSSTTRVTKAPKPRQRGKQPVTKPKNSLKQAFRATKALPLPTSVKALQNEKENKAGLDLSDRSSPSLLDLSAPHSLPSLRPNQPKPLAISYTVEVDPSASELSFDECSTPATPRRHSRPPSPDTVSPGSKPHRMEHLID